MKRIIGCLLFVVLLCSCVAPVCAKEEEAKAITVSVSEESGVYVARILLSGVREEDDLGALQFSVSYPAEKLAGQKIQKGPVLLSFELNVGPPSRTKNPATFLAVSVSEPVVANGVLATLYLKPVSGASGEAEIALSGVEVRSRVEEKKLNDAFALQNATVVLSGAPEAEPDCLTGKAAHTDFDWVEDPGTEHGLMRTCSVCGTTETMIAKEPSTAPLQKEGVSLAGEEKGLPKQTQLLVSEIDTALSEEQKAFLEEQMPQKQVSVRSAHEISLRLDGAELLPSEALSLSLPAPEGVTEGEGVSLLLEASGGTRALVFARCEAGKLLFSSQVLGRFYVLDTNASEAQSGENEPAENTPESPVAPEDGGESAPAKEQTTAFPEWILFAVIGALALFAGAVTALYFVRKQRRKKEESEAGDDAQN